MPEERLRKIDQLVDRIRRIPGVKNCIREEYWHDQKSTSATIAVILHFNQAAASARNYRLVASPQDVCAAIRHIMSSIPGLILISPINRLAAAPGRPGCYVDTDIVFSVIVANYKSIIGGGKWESMSQL